MTDRAAHTTFSRPIEVLPKLPNTALPDADWADAFEVVSKRRFANMRELAPESIGSMPVWARRLLDLRNNIVRPFGLKPDGINDAPDHRARVDIFSIISEAEDEMVLGLDDKHVDFRMVLKRAPRCPATRAFASRLSSIATTCSGVSISWRSRPFTKQSPRRLCVSSHEVLPHTQKNHNAPVIMIPATIVVALIARAPA